MKKTSVISINLKFLRLPLLLSLILLTTHILATAMRHLPPINLSPEEVNAMLSSNAIIADKKGSTHTRVFALLDERSVPATAIRKQETKEEQTISLATKKPPQISKTVIPSNIKVEVTNSTKHNLDTEKYNQIPSFMQEDFSVLIVHTHTTESYTPSANYNYKPTDTDRTTDKNYNMARIGKEIENELVKNGIKVHHDTSVNDYPSYNGSYNKSLRVASDHIKKDPSIKIILDVHRDAIEGKNGEKIKYTAKINSREASKVMLVVGSNLSGLEHKNWEENLNFAFQMQRHISSIYPDLMRPVNFRSQRFNQHLAPGAIIVEVGTNGNTLDEAMLGARYFAEGLADFIKSQK